MYAKNLKSRKPQNNLPKKIAHSKMFTSPRKRLWEKERRVTRCAQDTAVVCFDLHNVITCPKVESSRFFYKRKMKIYKLIAHVSINGKKQAYCPIWSECHAWRGGYEIVSALYKILCDVCQKHSEVKRIITWSDSCVSQNRNSFISTAILHFLHEHATIASVEMKYSVPGHSCIQEVDNIHSQPERWVKFDEFFQPYRS